MYKAKISKDDINLLPVIVFSGKITVVDQLEMLDRCVEIIRSEKIVGIDTETKPSFTRGTHHKVSLLQISTYDHCFLFRLNKIGLPKQIIDILTDVKIKKIGLSLRDDFNGLNKQRAFKPVNIIDIQSVIKNYGVMELSLQKIYAIIFGSKISKSQRLTNWENEELSELQQRYAATDAWACLQIYNQLQSIPKLSKKKVDELIAEHVRQQQLHQQMKQQESRPTE